MIRRTLLAMRLICAISAFLFVNSQAALAQNKVLELDGNDSYVELPAKLLVGVKEITVEGWVKWERFRSFSRRGMLMLGCCIPVAPALRVLG